MDSVIDEGLQNKGSVRAGITRNAVARIAVVGLVMGSDLQGFEPPCSAHIRSEIWDVGMELPPLRSSSGPVKVGYGKNSEDSDLVLPLGGLRAVLEMGVMGLLVKSGDPCWKSLPMFVRHGPAWVGLGIHAQARCVAFKKATPMAGNIGLGLKFVVQIELLNSRRYKRRSLNFLSSVSIALV